MLTSNKAALGALAMLVPVVALSGLVGIDPGRASATSLPAAGGYTLRCWQDGRLILEEQHVSMPPGVDGGTTRLQVIDRNQRPMVVAETKNATCLVKAQPPQRPKSTLP
jgi:hypothetical protein